MSRRKKPSMCSEEIIQTVWIFWRLVNLESRWSWPIGFYGGGNALVVPVFNIRALVLPTVGFSLNNTTPPPANLWVQMFENYIDI